MSSNLSKQHLYEAVKTLVELDQPHIHLTQHKLFTLFSVAFQYMLFRSTKMPGAYIIRVEDSQLADKLAKKAKDPSTKNFMQTLLLPRKYKYERSVFYLDFFHLGSWNLTNEIPKDRIQGAIIIKNTSTKPMNPGDELDEEEENPHADLPKDYYLSSLTNVAPMTITMAYDCTFDGLHQVEFPFIKKEREKTVGGVTISDRFDWDNINE